MLEMMYHECNILHQVNIAPGLKSQYTMNISILSLHNWKQILLNILVFVFDESYMKFDFTESS